ncbi:hypothetical protein U1329_03515 [Enterococcus cecorum]|uniref:hypothetical protein n=1 Tax=Enterococcus cecorum TaxID=44008 RepID=UPI000643C6A1|nr:hypothetical protein [Enterococcus cecorum]KLO73213.1 hypothetical protein AA989_08440 [Enterococcus cecorum]MDZ5439576.1 hypothetical protein [Enterococcus cecorum]MDZ5497629.1 hypothetical protein [Enterococcus cecorum]MDZ5562269.1 hypothetical protein [Enterococcus cecorum]
MNQIISWLLENTGLLSIISSLLTVSFLSLSTFSEYVSLDKFFRTHYFSKKSVIVSELVQMILLIACSAILPVSILFLAATLADKNISIELIIKNQNNFLLCYSLIMIWIGFIFSLYLYSLKKSDKKEYIFSEYYVLSEDLNLPIANFPQNTKLYIQNFFKGKFLLLYYSDDNQNVARLLVEESKLFTVPIYYNNDINKNKNKNGHFDKAKNTFYGISLIILGIITLIMTVLGALAFIANN